MLLYDIDNKDGYNIGELAGRSMRKYDNNVRLLRYNFPKCFVSNVNAVFQRFRCPNCDTLFRTTFNLERHLTTCSERVKNVYPRNICQIREILFDKLDSFAIKYKSQQNFSTKLAIIDFDSIHVQEKSLKATKTTTWIRKRVPTSVAIPSNLVEEPTFLYNSEPHHLVPSFIGTLEGTALQSKAQMKLLFLDIVTIKVKINLSSILEKVSYRRNGREHARIDMNQDDCDNEICA